MREGWREYVREGDKEEGSEEGGREVREGEHQRA